MARCVARVRTSPGNVVVGVLAAIVLLVSLATDRSVLNALSPDEAVVTRQIEISATASAVALAAGDRFGTHVDTVGDIDGDGIADLVVGSGLFNDGLWILTMNADASVKQEYRFSATDPGFRGQLGAGPSLAWSAASLGDLDGDGREEVIFGAYNDDTAGVDAGAAFVVFFNADVTIRTVTKITQGWNGFVGGVDAGDGFGYTGSLGGDLDGDGVPDAVIGAPGDATAGPSAGAIHVLFMRSDGSVRTSRKITRGLANFTGDIGPGDVFGRTVTGAGDLDGDGVLDVVVGNRGDDDGGENSGALWVLFMNSDGTVKSHKKWSAAQEPLSGVLAAGDNLETFVRLSDIDGDGVGDAAIGSLHGDLYGQDMGAVYVAFLTAAGDIRSVTPLDAEHGFVPDVRGGQVGQDLNAIGDYDGDGLAELAIGSNGVDAVAADAGAFWIVSLGNDADGDGLLNVDEDVNSDGIVTNDDTDQDGTPNFRDADDDGDSIPTAVETFGGRMADFDGDGRPNYLDWDDDGDGIGTLTEGADPNGDGSVGDALDKNRNGIPDYLERALGRASLEGPTAQTVSGGSWTIETPAGAFGVIGDVNRDGVADLATSNGSGIVTVLMNPDGSVQAEIAMGVAGVASSFATIGDVNGDGITDLAIGMADAGADGQNTGAVLIVALHADGTGTVLNTIDTTVAALGLVAQDRFGAVVTSVGDLDGNGSVDIAVASSSPNDIAADSGAVWTLLMAPNGDVLQVNRPLVSQPDLFGGISEFDYFGTSAAGVGDIDGDGVGDLILGAAGADDGGEGAGAVYVLFLNADGSVRTVVEQSATTSGLALTFDRFGSGLAMLGDIDGDGRPEIAVTDTADIAAPDGGSIHILSIQPDGSLTHRVQVSSALFAEGFQVGGPISLGDLTGDGGPDIVVQPNPTEPGSTDRSPIIVSLGPEPVPATTTVPPPTTLPPVPTTVPAQPTAPVQTTQPPATSTTTVEETTTEPPESSTLPDSTLAPTTTLDPNAAPDLVVSISQVNTGKADDRAEIVVRNEGDAVARNVQVTITGTVDLEGLPPAVTGCEIVEPEKTVCDVSSLAPGDAVVLGITLANNRRIAQDLIVSAVSETVERTAGNNVISQRIEDVFSEVSSVGLNADAGIWAGLLIVTSLAAMVLIVGVAGGRRDDWFTEPSSGLPQ